MPLLFNYSVFISHSKLDHRKTFFSNAFATSGVQAHFEEYQPKHSKNNAPWMEIKKHIFSSRATFVVLSEPLEDVNYRHTMNWIDFEVGISLGFNHPVWVFEPAERVINFAVPYATHHSYYNFDSDENIQWLVEVLRNGNLSNHLPQRFFTCPKCGLKFTQLNLNFEEFVCPSCRERLQTTK